MLADLVMAVHFVVLAYIVLPFAAWGLTISLGATCPLTTLENHLRDASSEGFIGYTGAILAWQHRRRPPAPEIQPTGKA